jgi:hypothetical protein
MIQKRQQLMARYIAALLVALLFSPAFAQDIYNPSCSGPWTTYAASASAQTPGGTPPTFTQNAARYKLCGNKTVLLEADFTVTAAGTGSGGIRITLPFTAASNNNAHFPGSANEYSALGIGGWASINPGGTIVTAASTVAATPFIVTGQAIAVGITYEIP